MENEQVLFVGLTVASQASQAPELLLGRPRIVLLERERPALPVDTCRCQEGGQQGTKAPGHQGSHPGGTRASASPKLHTSEPLNCASTHPPLLSLNEDENKGSLNWRQCTVTV